MRRPYPVILLAALIAVSPVLLFGTSCGHDIGFHMQSWMDAAVQLRHGTLFPRWAFSPAWQAGEPRFIFYPPLSWMFGALLTLVLPMPATPNTFLFVAILAAGVSMYVTARRFTSPNGSLVAACVYLANPYMLFNAFERSAYAELLAATWIPLLFLAVLQDETSILTAALGIALAWLTNVPSGIMATYTFVVLAVVRLLVDRHSDRTTLRLSAFRMAAELVIGVALIGFYLLPAAVERRYVQSSMLMIENLRYQDNYLFHNTAWEPHNVVTHTVSLLAVVMLIAAACILAWLFFGSSSKVHDPKLRRTRIGLASLFALILFLLLPISGLVWHIAPELPFLQFPWRLLTILSAVLALGLALALHNWQSRLSLTPVIALLYVATVTGICSHLYRQACEIPHMAQTMQDTFRAGHGVSATDEYTPGDADNDVLRTDNPGYWLAPIADPSAYAPGTVANPNEYDPNFDGPIPYQFTKAEHAPTHLDLNLRQPAVLVLNLRNFPDWRISRNGQTDSDRLRRDDGLMAIPLPAGPSHIDVAWHRGWDNYAGDALSLAALVTLIFLRRRDSERLQHVH